MPMESGTLAADEKLEELDEDMTEDVMLLSGMIRQGFPTVQADAASVVAGLTSTGERSLGVSHELKNVCC